MCPTRLQKWQLHNLQMLFTSIGARPIKTTSHRRFLTDGADLDDTQTNDMWMCAFPEEKEWKEVWFLQYFIYK